ncbi:probable receptor-like protein kinase At1g49730 isoform X1 [Coffea eugenioides]|uniref:probable receptor-like protein kinase At1g49730 isoform X1 n=1 Tax=Coffea eugenioides TaxID=49369 RepID=UPI000F5C5AB7|nr:probable receptor-like protein kinase At1g49730 isoform X1 [Coffea arabica]XP_027181376.1 probable receptor-like protein kinase At1g49730 isoform X1 [Coffea eugenioides]
MGSEILKLRLLLLAWFHLKSRPTSVYFVKCFSHKDLKKATDGFKRIQDSSINGTTYRAKFHNGHIAVVKEIRMFDNLDDDAFCRKVQLLSRLHHRHIASLSGYSAGNKRFLVYEHLEKGSLKDYLSDPLKTPLNWRTRLQIAIGIASALEYLHFFCDPPIYHVSINSSTVMLDDNFSPKLCDVGLPSSAGSHKTLPNTSERERCDKSCNDSIFQLGLLILELITGQSSDNGGVDLVQWVQESRLPTSISMMIDPDLGNSYNSRELRSLLAVARLCIESVNKPSKCSSQILLRYLTTK